MDIKEQARQIKIDSSSMANTSFSTRNLALQNIALALEEHKDAIIKANLMDIENAKENQVPEPVLKRLKFDEGKLADVIAGIKDLIGLSDPLFQRQLDRSLDEGLKLYRETCPIGVIGVIFEARPDALVQISALCIKSGNCAILKGGSEALRSNKVLFDIIYQAAVSSGLPEGCLLQIEAREDIHQLLSCHDSVDLLIPRGSNEFVQYIMNHTRIPVMGHAEGICHIYVDASYDLQKALPIIVDAKTQYVAACNTVETLLIHEQIAEEFLPKLKEILSKHHVTIKGSKRVQEIIDCEIASEEDFKTEYSDYIVTVHLVDSLEEAILHINRYGSHHTDCIISEDTEHMEQFMQYVDSAGVYSNCSTRFADGFRYGFGAEVGISTGKLHARGPVGLEGLVTYKYKLFGNGHKVDDYATGKKQFHFVDYQIEKE